MKKVYLFTPVEGRTEDINNYISAAANILRAMFENHGEEIEIVTNFNLEPAGTDADGEKITKIRNCDNPILYMSEELALINGCDCVARPQYYSSFGFRKWSEALYNDEFQNVLDDHKQIMRIDERFLPQPSIIPGNKRRYIPVAFNARDCEEVPISMKRFI